MSTAPDPGRTSHYVTDAFYDALVKDFTDWQKDDAAVGDVALRDSARAFLEREARLLDRHLFASFQDEPGCPGTTATCANDSRHVV